MSLDWEAGVFITTPRHLREDKEGEIYFKENKDNLKKRTVGYEMPFLKSRYLQELMGSLKLTKMLWEAVSILENCSS